MYSLSSCWNSHRHTDGRAMLREIREQGFEYAELSHGTRISLLPGIMEAVDAGEIKISSVHNFCPLPMGVNGSAPNLYKFTAERTRERELAVRHTLKTIEFAARVKAKVAVLHLGSIEMRDYTDPLLELVEQGQGESAKYEKLCDECIDKRERRKEEHLDRLYDCLRQILPEAEKRGVMLGCENREGLEELPLEPDFHNLFRELTSPNLVYWHDTGHAQIKENLGFVDHAAHLESLRAKLFGFHVHDVQFPGRDHCAPGTGMIDFAKLKPLVQPHHLKIFEFSPRMPVEELQRGVAHLKSIWGEG
jgi:sugar phosphate isomerase/epimerase